MSKTTVWKVLHQRFVFKPYHIKMVQQLSDEDHRHRLDFCLQLQDLMSSDDHFLWIKGQRISWLGHLERMEEDRMHKKIIQELKGIEKNG